MVVELYHKRDKDQIQVTCRKTWLQGKDPNRGVAVTLQNMTEWHLVDLAVGQRPGSTATGCTQSASNSIWREACLEKKMWFLHMEWTAIKYIENPLSCRESDTIKILPAWTKRNWNVFEATKTSEPPIFFRWEASWENLVTQNRCKFLCPLRKPQETWRRGVSEDRAWTGGLTPPLDPAVPPLPWNRTKTQETLPLMVYIGKQSKRNGYMYNWFLFLYTWN